MLDNISKILTGEDRSDMERCPDEAEIKTFVFDLNKNSASGPNGFSRGFFQIARRL